MRFVNVFFVPGSSVSLDIVCKVNVKSPAWASNAKKRVLLEADGFL